MAGRGSRQAPKTFKKLALDGLAFIVVGVVVGAVVVVGAGAGENVRAVGAVVGVIVRAAVVGVGAGVDVGAAGSSRWVGRRMEPTEESAAALALCVFECVFGVRPSRCNAACCKEVNSCFFWTHGVQRV